MFELFYMGGPLFMGLLTILFLIIIVIAARKVLSGEMKNLGLIKSIGLLALVVGVLGQMIGMYSAFAAIEMMGEGGISPAMLAGGLKVSSITTVYGLLIYAISLLVWIILSALAKK